MPDAKLFKEHIRATNKAITSTVAALHLAQRDLSYLKVGSAEYGDLHVKLIMETMLRGEFLVWYRNLSFQMDLSDFETWLKNPIAAAATAYQVDEQTFTRWIKIIDQDDVREVSVSCRHHKCRMTKTLCFDNPKEMHDAEVSSISEIWYCHHHKNIAWKEHGVISDELLPILMKTKQFPGCNKAKLNCSKQDLEFLCSIGLMQLKGALHGAKIVGYESYLTSDGVVFLSNYYDQL